MANELMKLGKAYLSNYERQYDVLKSTDYFSQDDWTQNAQKGRLNEYINLLSQQSKLPSSFYNDYKIGYLDNDGRFYSMYNELYGDKTNATERFEEYTDEYGTKQKKSLGSMSDYNYNKYLLNQQADYKLYELDQKVKQEIKDNNQGWMWLTDMFTYAGYGSRKVLSGAVRFVDDITNLVGALVDGTKAVLDGGSFADTFEQVSKDRTYAFAGTGTKDKDVFAGLDEALLDFERNYTNIRNIDGSYSTLGSLITSTTDSIGYMLPTILLTQGVGTIASSGTETSSLLSGATNVSAGAAGTAAASKVGQASRFIFYAGQFSGTMTENAQNTSLESVGSWAKISNAALSTALEAGVETLLGKIWDSSVLDNLHYSNTNKIGSALSGKTFTYIKGKPQINGLLRIAKGAVQEGIEEVLQDISTYFVNAAYSVIDEHFYQDYTFQDAMNSFVVSLLSSSLMSSVDVAKTKRYDTGEAKTTKDGKLVLDKNGDAKTKQWSKLKTWTVNADMNSFVNKYQEIMTGNMSTEKRKAAVMELYAGYRIMGQLYSSMGSEKFNKACQFLDEVIAKIETGNYIDVVSRVREDFKTNDREMRIAKAEQDVINAQNNVDIIKKSKDANLVTVTTDKGIFSYVRGEGFENFTQIVPTTELDKAKNQLKNAKDALRKAKSYDIITRPKMLSNDVFDEKASKRQKVFQSGEALTYIDQYCKDIATYVRQALDNLELSQRKYFAEKIRDARIQTVKDTVTRTFIEQGMDEETASQISKEYVNTLTQIFSYDKSIEQIIITGEGNNTVAIDKTLFVPIQMLRNSNGSVILSSKAENEIVDEIVLNKSSNPYFQNLVSLYRELSGIAEATEVEAVYNMLYNATFFNMALYASHQYSVELLAQITDFVTKQSKLVKNSVYDALYTKKLNEIAQRMKEQFVNYAINQQEFDISNYDFLTTNEKKSIIQQRWGKEFSNKIIRGDKLSETELKVITNRVNSLPIVQEQKDKILANITSVFRENRYNALKILNNYYNGVFLSLYNDETYLVPSSKGAIAFNNFLQNVGLTLKTIGNVPTQDSDVYKAVADKYKQVNKNSVLAYYNKLFSQFTNGEYTFSINNNRIIIENKKQTKALGFNKAYYKRRGITNLNVNTFKTFVYPIVENVNKLVNEISKPGTSSLVSINDVISEPDKFLSESIQSKILAKYNEITEETVFVYLNELYSKEGITIVQLRNGEYKYASLHNIKDIVKNDFALVSNTDNVIDIKDVVNEKYLIGELRNTKIYFGNGVQNTQYNPLSNTIYISQADIDNAKGRPLNFVIAHEFQHAVQYFNGMALGISYNFFTNRKVSKNVRDSIVSDIMRHKPDMFKEKGVTDKNIEIAQQYLYYSSGEAMAYGLQGTDLFDFQPTIIGFNKKSYTIQFPWGSKYYLDRSAFSDMALKPVNGYFDFSESVVKGTINVSNDVDEIGTQYSNLIHYALNASITQAQKFELLSIVKSLPSGTNLQLVPMTDIIKLLNTKRVSFSPFEYLLYCSFFGSELKFQRALREIIEIYCKVSPNNLIEQSNEYKEIYTSNVTLNNHDYDEYSGIVSTRTLLEKHPEYTRDSLRLMNLMYFPRVKFKDFMKSKIAFFRYGSQYKSANLYSAFVLLPDLGNYIDVWTDIGNQNAYGIPISQNFYIGRVDVKDILGYFPEEHEIVIKPEVLSDVKNRGFSRNATGVLFRESINETNNMYLSVLVPVLGPTDIMHDVESYDNYEDDDTSWLNDALTSDLKPADEEKFEKKYVSKSFAKGTNLEPFVTGNRDYQKYMSKEMQQFVYSTTGLDLYAEFPNEIARKIKNGTLERNDVMYYFMRGNAAKNNYFFELVNNAFFKNTYIQNDAQLRYLMNNYSTEMYAASIILKILQNDKKYKNLIPSDILNKLNTHVNGVKYFDKVKQFILSLDDEIKQKYYNLIALGEGIQGAVYSPEGKLIKSGTEKAVLQYSQVRPWIRYLYMKYYDGTLASIEKIVKLVRYAMITGRGVNKNIVDIIPERANSISTIKKGSSAGDTFETDIENISNNMDVYVEDSALNAVLEDLSETEARKTLLLHKAEELVEQYKKEEWSDIVFNKQYKAMLHEVDTLFSTDPENALKLAAAYELTGIDVNKKVSALSKQVIATNIVKNSKFRGRGNVLRNVKAIASWIRNNISNKQLSLINEKYSGIFEKDGSLRKDTFQKEKTVNGITEKVTVPTEELLKVETVLKEIRTAVRNDAFDNKKSLQLYDKLQKQKVSQQKLVAKYERKISKLQQQIEERYGVTVAITGNDKFVLDENATMPPSLTKLLDTEFDRLSPTKVQTISSMDDTQVTVSLKEFIDKNTDTLITMEDADLVDIVHFYTSTQLVNGIGTELAQKKYAIAEMAILTYILHSQREGSRALSNSDVKAVENLLYGLANNSANILTSWRDALKILKPEERIISNIAKAEGVVITDEQVRRIMDAVSTKNVDEVSKIVKDLYQEIYKKQIELNVSLTPKSKFDKFLDRLVSFQQTAMLSSPSTWLKNQVSNPLVLATNRAGEVIGNLFSKIFPKKKQYANQYKIVGTKVSNKTKNFIYENVTSVGLLTLIDDGISKYDPRKGSIKGTGISAADALSEMILHKIARDVFNNTHNAFEGKNKLSKAYLATQTFIQKMLTDVPYIHRATIRYFGKMLTEDGTDLSQGLTKQVLDTLATAYTYAAMDYMHTSNVFNEIERAIYNKAGSKGRFVLKQISPFLSTSWNWFVKGLEYTPASLVKSIIQYCKLEKTIAKAEINYQQGKTKLSPRLIEYTIKRKIGNGIIGTIGLGIGILLGALGVASIDKDDDDKIKIKIGDVYIDISELTGFSTIAMGMALTNPSDGKWTDAVLNTIDIMFDDFVVSDIINDLRYTDTISEWLIKQPENALSKLIPNAIKMFSSVIQINKVKYDSGVLGSLERLAGYAFPGLTYAFPKRIDVYTGEVQSKYEIPFANELFNKLSPLKISYYKVSDLEKTAMGLGLLDTELSGKYKDNVGTLSLKEKSVLNQKYGQLNNKYLTEFINNKTKYSVEMSDGTWKELYYKQMTNEQRAYAFKGIKSKNSKLAKVYVATVLKGMKYYGTKTEYQLLKENKITKNVFIKTKSLEGFY